MDLPGRLTSALQALAAAVEHLEAATARRASRDPASEPGATVAELRDQHATLVAARAADGDRMAALLRVNDRVGLRLERVATALRAIAERQDGSSPDPRG